MTWPKKMNGIFGFSAPKNTQISWKTFDLWKKVFERRPVLMIVKILLHIRKSLRKVRCGRISVVCSKDILGGEGRGIECRCHPRRIYPCNLSSQLFSKLGTIWKYNLGLCFRKTTFYLFLLNLENLRSSARVTFKNPIFQSMDELGIVRS